MKPNNKIIAGLAFMAVCLTAFAVTAAERGNLNANAGEATPNGPQTDPGDTWSARSGLRSVGPSNRYEWLMHSTPDFRTVRERKECGPTNDAPVHAECNASLGN